MKCSKREAEAADVVTKRMLNLPAGDPLWSPPDGISLYNCLGAGLLACIGCLW